MLVQVAVSCKLDYQQDILIYRVPIDLEPCVQLGSLVMVPMGKKNQQFNGYVVGFLTEKNVDLDIQYKSILYVLDSELLLIPELVNLAVWMSAYYLSPCYYILEYMLPKFARHKRQKFVIWVGDSDLVQSQIVLLDSQTACVAKLIRQKKEILMETLEKQYPQLYFILQKLEQIGMIRIEERFLQQGKNRVEFLYESCVDPQHLENVRIQLGRAEKQWEILRYLTYNGGSTGKNLRRYWPNYIALTKELLRKGLITRQEKVIQRFNIDHAIFRNDKKFILNKEQQDALEVILSKVDMNETAEILLHGVTGSGKTEVYLQTLRYILEKKQGAMILVPEISLTPQLIGRFRAVLGEYVEVLHSNMSDGERYDAWCRLYHGETRVVVGVRSAVFAPVRNLRLIIIDEEHEVTFKQSEPDPRYHARDVARKRMQQNNGLLLLGSATPSVQTYYGIQKTGSLLTLQHRATHQPLPEVEIVNMAQEFQTGNRSMFSSVLVQAMENSLNNGEQVILFLNRRGFSSAIVCRECGHTITCEKCSIALTYHKEQNLAKCHYCDYMTPAPKKCPQCGSRFIRYMGSGTELVEMEVKKRWPWVRTERMDLDTTQNKEAHNQILERFARGETKILIGTQMVTKGLDFPDVTTVGVLAADMILNLPDYTASERTFQLLTQVAGRAGRGNKMGHVVIQTYNPEHYSILAAQRHNFLDFYEKEIQIRKLLLYPPFCYMIRILISDFNADGLLELLQQVSEKIIARYSDIELLGPAESPIFMVRRRYRFQLLLKGNSLDLLREAAKYGKTVMNLSRKSKTLRILIDVEPVSVL